MIALVKQGNSSNIPIEQWTIDTEEEIEQLPDNIPFGSFLMIIEPFDIRILNGSGEWISISGGEK